MKVGIQTAHPRTTEAVRALLESGGVDIVESTDAEVLIQDLETLLENPNPPSRVVAVNTTPGFADTTRLGPHQAEVEMPFRRDEFLKALAIATRA